MNEATLIWLGIVLCVSQSATLSGLNLAVFSISRLRLEVGASQGDRRALRVLALRENANFTLVTILWGNVAVNVLLTLLAESVLAGVAAFLFSTVVITFVGEIIPQAYFTRHALRVASLLSPVLRVYQCLLWPVAWPVAKVLDRLIGPEGIPWLRERELRDLLRQHAEAGTEVGPVEARGAINFLALDDVPAVREGEPLAPDSVIELPFVAGRPVFPAFSRDPDDPFLRRLAASGKKWLVLVDETARPRFVLNSHRALREALLADQPPDLARLIHRALVIDDPAEPLGRALTRLSVRPEHAEDNVIDEDLIVLWSEGERRIITGSDILGRLLHGIVRQAAPAPGQL
ncbi:MAG: DUF21 domain-containing protein [Gammaproteobacteria bacterium]|nr:DUF21 domain-containing protein [Gammaproteobacteria bacterium]TVQ50548.1 MAG: DUF21 domain-containing protein [Gammaproteobacteria bacterium]